MDDRKQYLNLSDNAFYILNCDASAFAGKKVSSSRVENGFLNRIFLNFLEDNEKMTALLENRAIYQKGKQFNFRLRNEAEKKICSIESDKTGKIYQKFIGTDPNYFSRSKFLKAVFEKYAVLPYYERERVYFRKEFRLLQLYCEVSQKIEFDYRRADGNRHIRLLPYDIRLDEWSSYNYLIGITENNKIINCRLSFIGNLQETSGEFPVLDRQAIENRIMTNGVQFLSGTPETIIVRLTPKGQNMYSTMIYLRPHYTECDPETGIYQFFCTSTQASYYFFKFGQDAEMIQPVRLREQFLENYHKSAENYKKL